MQRWPFLLLAYLCIGLALIGVVLPGLPTVPFLLVAAWAGARGSARLHDWIEAHPVLGPPLRDWREQGAVPRRGKALAVVMMLVSWGLLTWHTDAIWVSFAAGLLFTAVSAFLLSRPTPRRVR